MRDRRLRAGDSGRRRTYSCRINPPELFEGVRMAMQEDSRPPGRRPSPLAQQLADAFAPCGEWSEVRVIREGSDRRAEVIQLNRQEGDGPAPYDWAEAA
jgi:hypothetical protein